MNLRVDDAPRARARPGARDQSPDTDGPERSGGAGSGAAPWVGLLRLGLAVLFAFSGWSKLQDPLAFAFAIKAFKTGLPDFAVARAAYVVPWLDLLCALALLRRGWARPAGTILAGLMLLFGGLIVSLLARGLDVHCPCFGSFALFCDGPMGACHLVRNGLIAAAAFVVAAACRPGGKSRLPPAPPADRR